MASSFHQWELDPLFSAAEVVQDSADRMESILHLLLHEQSLVQEAHPQPKLLESIKYHRRDLATTLETAKWQLEDFEKAVGLSAIRDKSPVREDAIYRHKQFIGAIREHIRHVEKSLDDSSMGDLMINTEWVNLNEQDRDGLALFLSGGKPMEHISHHGSEGGSIMRRFLDPTTASNFNDNTDEIVEHKNRDIEVSYMNGIVHADHNIDAIKENKLRKVGSHSSSSQTGSAAPDFFQQIESGRFGEDGSLDVEANETKDKGFFHKNRLRGFQSRWNFIRLFGNLWSACAITVTRNFTKRLKDRDEERPSPSYGDVSHASKAHHFRLKLASGYNSLERSCFDLFTRITHSRSWLGACMRRYQRSPYYIQVNQYSIRSILIILFTLVVLGLLVSKVA